MKVLATLLTLFIMTTAWAGEGETYTQNVRGRVIDMQTQVPLQGAAVQVFHNGFSKGTITDAQGYFELTEVPVGRVTVLTSYLGYFPRQYENVPLTTGKELVLNVEMEQQVIDRKSVV